MGFDLQGLVPGIGGTLNVKALDTPLVNIAKRVYGQVQTYFDDKMNLQNVQAMMQKRASAANQPGEINNFIATIRSTGIAKPNSYAAQVLPPGSLGGKYTDLFRTTSMLCESAEFPSINIMTSQFRTYGPFIEIPYMRVNEPITLTFITDSSMNAKALFDAWTDIIIDKNTNDVSLYENIVGSINLIQKSWETTEDVYVVTLDRAYPKHVSAMPLSYSEQGSYHKVQVQFVYEKAVATQVKVQNATSGMSVRDQMNKVSGLDKVKNVASSAISGIQNSASGLLDQARSSTLYTSATDAVSSAKTKFSSFF